MLTYLHFPQLGSFIAPTRECYRKLSNNIPSPKTYNFNVQISWNWMDETYEQNSLTLEALCPSRIQVLDGVKNEENDEQRNSYTATDY